jgi:hypothetical protein
MRAIRAKHYRMDDPRRTDELNEIRADRNTFMTLMKEIVQGLKQLCSTQIDAIVLQQVMNAPKESIVAWCEATIVKIEQTDVGYDMEDGSAIVPYGNDRVVNTNSYNGENC